MMPARVTCKSSCARNWADFGLWAAGDGLWRSVSAGLPAPSPLVRLLVELLTWECQGWAPVRCWGLPQHFLELWWSNFSQTFPRGAWSGAGVHIPPPPVGWPPPGRRVLVSRFLPTLWGASLSLKPRWVWKRMKTSKRIVFSAQVSIGFAFLPSIEANPLTQTTNHI